MLDELRELYQEVIMDHSRSPRHFGHPNHATHQAEGDNPVCGDRLTVYLSLEGDMVKEVHFEGKGCAISTASASMMTEMLTGRPVEDARILFSYFHYLCTEDDQLALKELSTKIKEEDLQRLQVLAGVKQFPMRVKCATLAWHTMKAALSDEKQASTE